MSEKWGYSSKETHPNGLLIKKVKRFASQLAEWDNHLIEVFALEEIEATTVEREKLTLICTFDPEPANDSVGFFWIVNLLVRSEYEGLQENIGLNHSIDLGLRIGEDIFLPGGSVLGLPDEGTIVWPDYGEQKQLKFR